MRIGFALCIAAVLASGCTLLDRQERRINYTERLDEGRPSLITDAKQRAIINTEANVGVGDFKYEFDVATGEYKRLGMVDGDSVVKNHPNRIICAEPSPDVAQAISAAFTAAAQVEVNQSAAPAAGAAAGATQGAQGSGSLGSSYAASIAQLGERLATVQLLRDKMYRACEAYQNGAISDTSYTLMLSRFDKTMSSMLAAEVAAGAFGRNLAALGGSASTSGVDPKKLAEASDAVKAAGEKLKTASAVADAAQRKTEVDKAVAELNAKVSDLIALEFQSAATMAQSGPAGSGSGAIGQIVGRGAIDADAVALINTNYLDDDATGTIIDACVVALDRNRSAGPSKDVLAAQQKAEGERDEALAAATKAQTALDSARDAEVVAAMPGVVEETPAERTARLEAEAAAAKERAARIGTLEAAAMDAARRAAAAEGKAEGLRAAATAAGADRPSLSNACKTILEQAATDTGLIAMLQKSKLDLRSVGVDVLAKQYVAEAERAKVAPALADKCFKLTEGLPDAPTKMNKYIECVGALP